MKIRVDIRTYRNSYMIRAFILWELSTTRTRIQLDTTRNIEVFLNKIVNTIIWTRNNNGTIMDNSLGLERRT